MKYTFQWPDRAWRDIAISFFLSCIECFLASCCKTVLCACLRCSTLRWSYSTSNNCRNSASINQAFWNQRHF